MLSSTPTLANRRVIFVVLDGVGVGALPDAPQFGDDGSHNGHPNAHTLDHCLTEYKKLTGKQLLLPTLEKLGLLELTENHRSKNPTQIRGAYGKALEVSRGKDTTTGHWEMMGIEVKTAFPTFPNGFSDELITRWCQENQLPGVLGNCVASGTEIIDRLAPEHVRTGKPILYTSADSVWQVAAHEEFFGLDRLISICKSARKICDEIHVSRVIARPFIGDPSKGKPWKRTYHRKDLSLQPLVPSVLNALEEAKIPILGIGKIANIYAASGIPKNWDTEGNTDGLKKLLQAVSEFKSGLIFCNLIDTDMLFGHRRDSVGFGNALQEIDTALGTLVNQLSPNDLLILSADHGNDPTAPGSDHTREHAPIIAFQPQMKGPIPLPIQSSFGNLGLTTWHFLTGQATAPTHSKWIGTSFLNHLPPVGAS